MAVATRDYTIQALHHALTVLETFLEPGKERIPFVCPITGNDFMLRVQGDRYKIIAPGTDFSITTGDPSW